MQQTHVDDESRRTAALALWRYGNDYLKAAQGLCEDMRITCNESQVHYHLAAQGIEFALKSFLRANHRDDQFLYFVEADGEFPEFMPMLATGTWILGQVAADVVADYFAYYTHGPASAVDDMLRRMRADLRATASKIPLLQ